MTSFAPDYQNLQKAAFNKAANRLPLYEHVISDKLMETILGKEFRELRYGDAREKEEYFKTYCDFYLKMGYDTFSFECPICHIMPHGGLLGGHGESVIKSYLDFEKYPWDDIPEIFFSTFSQDFDALKKVMPSGMKGVGGVGNGIFETVQDVMGFMHLAYTSSDDPELYEALFRKVGDIFLAIWTRFMELYGDMYCVLRMGDDLGFKTNTLLPTNDIRRLIVPEYARVVGLVHAYNKPFLLHSCGNIFDVMDDIIGTAKINAKHSNEDQIGAFPIWVERYGERIGNFGGIDTDAVCRLSAPEIKEYVIDTLRRVENCGGIAFGSGNSIPEYVPADNYLAMVNAVREYRDG